MPRKARATAAIIALMGESERHAWTLEDLQAELARRGHEINFSSIFRAADKLAADGTISKILLDDGRSRFELSRAHHDHLHCLRCGALVPVPCPFERANFGLFEQATGAVVFDHHLVLNGICGACRPAGSATPEMPGDASSRNEC